MRVVVMVVMMRVIIVIVFLDGETDFTNKDIFTIHQVHNVIPASNRFGQNGFHLGVEHKNTLRIGNIAHLRRFEDAAMR